MEKLVKRLEETWGRIYSDIQITRIYSDIQITSIDSPRITPQDKGTWEPDPNPLMTNHLLG